MRWDSHNADIVTTVSLVMIVLVFMATVVWLCAMVFVPLAVLVASLFGCLICAAVHFYLKGEQVTRAEEQHFKYND